MRPNRRCLSPVCPHDVGAVANGIIAVFEPEPESDSDLGLCREAAFCSGDVACSSEISGLQVASPIWRERCRAVAASSALHDIASTAEQLEVRRIVGTRERERYDVVEMPYGNRVVEP